MKFFCVGLSPSAESKSPRRQLLPSIGDDADDDGSSLTDIGYQLEIVCMVSVASAIYRCFCEMSFLLVYWIVGTCLDPQVVHCDSRLDLAAGDLKKRARRFVVLFESFYACRQDILSCVFLC